MSQPDLIAQLREARPVAPPELHERVRLIAVEAGLPPRGRITWRRAFVVLVPVAAAAALAAVMLPRGGDSTATARTTTTTSAQKRLMEPAPTAGIVDFGAGIYARDTGAVVESAGGSPGVVDPLSNAAAASEALKASTPAPLGDRAQQYTAALTLRVPTSNAISKATNRALQIAASLGGYPQIVRVNAETKDGAAYIVLKVPRNRVQDAVRRLGTLGTIVGENVEIEDLQAGVDQNARLIARLQGKLTGLRAQTETDLVNAQIASVTQRIESLQRSSAGTIRAAEYATVELELRTPPKPVPPAEAEDDGPLDGLGTAFHWIWIGAVYAFALGAPVIALVAIGFFLARGARRRREDRLLAS